MPVLTQLKLNVGTEQNPNMVLHDLHDIRISSTDVTTVTRLLGCDAGVNSIAPLTLANAASLLGGIMFYQKFGCDQPTTAGQIIDTGLRARGLIIVGANGTSSVAGYIASGNVLRPLAGFEPENISTSATSTLWQIYVDEGIVKAKNAAARSSHNFKLLIAQISPIEV